MLRNWLLGRILGQDLPEKLEMNPEQSKETLVLCIAWKYCCTPNLSRTWWNPPEILDELLYEIRCSSSSNSCRVPPGFLTKFLQEFMRSSVRNSCGVSPETSAKFLQECLWSSSRNSSKDPPVILVVFLQEFLQSSSRHSFGFPPGIHAISLNSDSLISLMIMFAAVEQGCLRSYSFEPIELR